MKHRIKNILLVLLAILFVVPAFSQDKRALDTKVADILARFPVDNIEHTSTLIEEIVQLGPDGIARFCDMAVPPGTGDDAQARFALGSLAQYAGAPGNEQIREKVETSLLLALDKANDKEVKAFFIRHLAYCGQSATISALEKYLNTPDLYSPAVTTLTSIGTDEAAHTIFRNVKDKTGLQQITFIKAIGALNYNPAGDYLTTLAGSTDNKTLKQVYAALAELGEANSANIFKEAAKKINFSKDPSETMESYLLYAKQLGENGQKELSNSFCSEVMKKCKGTGQLQFRSSALKNIHNNQGSASTQLLVKELKNKDKAYRNAVLRIAGEGLATTDIDKWISILKKVPPETQAELLHFLAPCHEKSVLEKAILPSLLSKDISVRNEAVRALAINQKEKAVQPLLGQLKRVQSDEEYPVLEEALLNTCSVKNCSLPAAQLDEVNDAGKVVLIHILGSRRATDYFGQVEKLCLSPVNKVKEAAFAALAPMAGPGDLENLLTLLKKTSDPQKVENVQQAIISVYSFGNHPEASVVLNEMTSEEMKEKLMPVLPYLNDKDVLGKVVYFLHNGKKNAKEAALKALANWTDVSALPALFGVFTESPSNMGEALKAYLRLVKESNIPDDQRLLWLKKIMPECKTTDEQKSVIATAASAKTFLSLVFVSKYLDHDELSNTAALAAMNIAMPTPGTKNGLTGLFVRETLGKVMEKLRGGDARYFKIDISEYLDKMPNDMGYLTIFNGKDLSGWQGLVKNPIERAKMTPEELAKEQVEADKKMGGNWSVKDGCIIFNGKGANLCTKKIYKDFDMLVDWRITKKGDSGIYLRGTPQVQIWDTSRVDVGAQVGSGGLYNNVINRSTPLVLADNAIGDWNTFRIRMVGNIVTVYLNGVLVVDHVPMENYWDRSLPMFSEGPIELQAHGTNLAFRNLYVREINLDNPH